MKDRDFKRNFRAMLVRLAVFTAALAVYSNDRDSLSFGEGVAFFAGKPYLLALWLALMGQLAFHLFSNARSAQRNRARGTLSADDETKAALVRRANAGALKVAALWIACNGIIAVLFYTRVIGRSELLLLTLFYFMCDLIAVLVFCPFSRFIMHNKCCMTCRIYDWGAIMAYTPMFFVPAFFSWTLAGMSLVIFIKWEAAYARRHELFFEYTCDALSCSKCAAPLCRIKRALSPKDFCVVAAKKVGEAVTKSHKSGRAPAHKHS
ncbi:MAG: hypothetical protein VB112_07495 [Oscillospiraceae bacterium]|nr:hypothetical protein [Oscillospiraceae bacterium]